VTFSETRAYASHTLLRNGILDRFGLTADLYHGGRDFLIQSIVNKLIPIRVPSPNNRYAELAWRGAGKSQPGLPATLADLFQQARTLAALEPSENFPRDEVLQGWLHDVGVVLTRLDDFCLVEPKEKEAIALRFACAAVDLLMFLRDIDPRSPRFNEYFRDRAILGTNR
jgi:hypothetical protein